MQLCSYVDARARATQCQYKRHDFWMSRTTVTENGKKFGGIISQILF
jgi:hypothetical protein